jgi:hypothetical protein
MSVTVKANSGIMRDDGLDELRGKAILEAWDAPIGPAMAEYVRALERSYLNWEQQRHLKSLDDVTFKVREINGGSA